MLPKNGASRGIRTPGGWVATICLILLAIEAWQADQELNPSLLFWRQPCCRYTICLTISVILSEYFEGFCAAELISEGPS